MIKNSIKILTISLMILCFAFPLYAEDALRSKNHDASKNIHANGVIIAKDAAITMEEVENKETVIKHKLAINHLDDEKYEIIQDEKVDRIMIKIFLNDGIIYAKDGFYLLENKMYYFDSNGHMVLGPCVDKEGNHYFFSYETGEMLEG